jgi:hypothetical protein
VIFLPSQLRNTDSSTIRIETGSRDMDPTPARSSAGKEWSLPVLPEDIGNAWSVSNESLDIAGPVKVD